MSIVIVKHTDATQGLLSPIKPKLVGSNKCRYCICVMDSGSCDTIHKAIIEANQIGAHCNQGELVYRDLAHDPKIIPYVPLGGDA